MKWFPPEAAPTTPQDRRFRHMRAERRSEHSGCKVSIGLSHTDWLVQDCGAPVGDHSPGRRKAWLARTPGGTRPGAYPESEISKADSGDVERDVLAGGFSLSGVLGTDRFAEHAAPPPRWRRPVAGRP